MLKLASHALRRATCLNGWWDMLPISGVPGDVVPSSGWLEKAFLTPSCWTKLDAAVRKKGERYFNEVKGIFKDGRPLEDYEFLCDAFGYPPEWSRSRMAWLRRFFEVKSVEPGRRHILRLDAVTPRCRLYVNGFHVASNPHPALPLEADITPYVKPGANELAVLVLDVDKDERGRSLAPSGNCNIDDNSGIWQDVWHLERGDLHVADVTVRTSVREGRIELRYELSNDSARARRLTVSPSVSRWAKGVDPLSAEPLFALAPITVELQPFSAMEISLVAAWSDAELWSPENPALHSLVSALLEDGVPVDVQVERFGFREVWIDGPDLMLNGHPAHLFSDWGHKGTPYYYTEAWIRQWFGMIRDGNMNHSRLHTHPHPQLCLDLADEEGILITGETGIHGSGGSQAADSLSYWTAAEDHIRRFVRRDKNHPCLILWSVGNEMRWNHDKTSLALERLPLLRKRFNELDPTRPAYHEGDSSLWDERAQPIISRHYMKCCSGYGWWDRQRPLHAGEMSLYHLIGPNNTSNLGGDAVWASFKAMDEAAARDTALIVETGRTLGVACFGPWNLSCRDNLRMETALVHLNYEDWAAPGVKPLLVPPHCAEFSFWKPGKGYTPNHAFPLQAQAFRPLALIDRSLKASCFAGTDFKRELFLVNDTAAARDGTIEARLFSPSGALAASVAFEVSVGRGQVVSQRISLRVPADGEGVFSYEASFKADGASDTWRRPLRVAKRAGREFGASLVGRMAVFGEGVMRKTLERLGVACSSVGDLELETLSGFELLLLEKDSVQAGTRLNRQLRDFARSGGRVLLLEQAVSPFSGLPLTDNPLQTQFVRAPHHPALKALADADFAFWGDAPYPAQGSDNYVVEKPYVKDDAKRALFLLDGDEGGFGTGGMGYSSLVDVREGGGCLLACQLLLSEKIEDEPAAELLLLNMLRFLDSFQPATKTSLEVADGAALDATTVAAKVKGGATVLVEGASAASLVALGKAFGVELRPVEMPDEYQAVRVKADPLLDGVSNEDCSGVDTFSYTAPDKRNVRTGKLYLEPVEGLEALLETATESCLKEIHVLNQRSFALYTNAISRFLYAEKPAKAVVLGSLRLGAGRLLLNQFVPEDVTAIPRLARLSNRLRAGLGQVFEGGLLDAADVETPQNGGKGYPERLAILNLEVSGELRQHLVDATRHSEDLFRGQPILSVAGWGRVDCADGELQAVGLDLSKDIYLFTGLQSPRRRKDPRSNLDCPNPEVLTFLDFEGEGSVELVVDCEAKPLVELVGGHGTVTDIGLDKGLNQVLLKWKPKAQGSTLKMRWRNIQGQAERGFEFFVPQ